MFTIHILVIDYFAPKTDGVQLSCVQFMVAGLLSAILMGIKEEPELPALVQCAGPLLYAGVLSSGVAYTLQILGQKNYNPSVAVLIMSLESSFSVLGGFLILGERLSGRELLGCLFMFTAIILAQLPENLKIKKGK